MKAKTLVGYLSLALLVYSVTLMATWPAQSLVTPWLDRYPALKIQQWRGNWHQGQIEGISWQNRPWPGTVSWQVHWPALLTAQAGIHWQWWRDSNHHADGGLLFKNRQQWQLTQVNGQLPLPWLLQRLGEGWPVDGQLILNQIALQVNGNQWQASGTIVLEKLVLAALENINLGTVKVQLNPHQQHTRAVLSNQGGVLALGGEVMIRANGVYNATLLLTARAEYPHAGALLKWLPGKAKGPNQKQITYKGRWR